MAEPAVDLAAPALRTRCCGGETDRGENRDLEGQQSNIDNGGAIRERLSVGKGLFERSAVAGWFGHVSDLCARPLICRWP
jgi:hypothetical protein